MTVNEVLSKFYGRPVVGGHNNGGWPVIWSATDPDTIVSGGIGCKVQPEVEAILRAQAALEEAIEGFDRKIEEIRGDGE